MTSRLRLNDDSPAAQVVVLVDVHSQLLAPLEIAASIAVAHKAVLHGVCVEDLDLWEVAELPFAREVTLLEGQARALEDQRLRRDMKLFLERFEQLLAERAERLSLPWSISTVRGRKHAMGLEVGAQPHLVVMAQSGPARAAPRHRVRILVISHRDEMLFPTLDIVLQQNPDCDVEVLLLNVDENVQHSPGFLSELQAYPGVYLTTVSQDMVPQLCTATSTPLDYIIASRQQDSALLAMVMQLAACPVILVS